MAALLPLPDSISIDGKSLTLEEAVGLLEELEQRRAALQEAQVEVYEHLGQLGEINQVRAVFQASLVTQAMIGPVRRFNRLLGGHLKLVGRYFSDNHELVSAAREMLVQGLIDEDQFRLISYPEYQVEFNPHQQRELAMFALVRADLIWAALQSVPVGKERLSFASLEELETALAETRHMEAIAQEAVAASAKLDLPWTSQQAHEAWTDEQGQAQPGTPLSSLLELEEQLRAESHPDRLVRPEHALLMGEELDRYVAGLYLRQLDLGKIEAVIARLLGKKLIESSLRLYLRRLGQHVPVKHRPHFEVKFLQPYRRLASI
jgi:hypothetical protein